MIGSGPRAGELFDVTEPSHVGALLRFSRGQSAQAIFSFDSAVSRILLEVNGRDATMILPGHGDPWPGTPAQAVTEARRGV